MAAVLYHVTTVDNAQIILRDGFRETAEFYSSDTNSNGVWLSDRPLNGNQGVRGDITLAVSFNLSLRELGFYKLVGIRKLYKEWCVPASVIRRYAKVSLLPPDLEDARIAHLSDLQLLGKTFATARSIDPLIEKSIFALTASMMLLAKVERQLNHRSR